MIVARPKEFASEKYINTEDGYWTSTSSVRLIQEVKLCILKGDIIIFDIYEPGDLWIYVKYNSSYGHLRAIILKDNVYYPLNRSLRLAKQYSKSYTSALPLNFDDREFIYQILREEITNEYRD